jgi:hypothetical protein
LASISAVELAREIIDDCLNYGTWSNRALDALVERALDETDEFVAAAATRALFSVVIERLADLFEPSLCEIYVRLFTRVIARAIPDYNAEDLLVRYRRVSQTRRFRGRRCYERCFGCYEGEISRGGNLPGGTCEKC